MAPTDSECHPFSRHTVLAARGTALLIESTRHVCQSLHQCAQVSTLVTSLPPLVERVAELEGRLTRSLTVAKQGLDILADQLVALGALNGRSSPNKNPLAGTAVPGLVSSEQLAFCPFLLTFVIHSY
jgi:hypothetical protein